MTDQLPDPPVPADVDLRGLEYMPFFGNHLFGSDFNASCTDGEWRAGVTLWWAAWNQVPAASLPNDDVALTRLADLGRDVRGFRKLKAKAMRGFVLCSDGRLYHLFLVKQALVAWDKRVKEREKKQRWRDEQDRKRRGLEPGQDRDKGGGQNGSRTGTRGGDGTADGTGSDGTGRDERPEEPSAPSAAHSTPAGSPNGHDLLDPPVEFIPLCDNTEFGVPKSFVAELDRLYPAVEPVQTLREIRGWCLGNPRRRKTPRGVRAFITSWFAREQDKQSRRAS